MRCHHLCVFPAQQLPSFEQFFHPCAQFVRIERLGEIGIRPRFQSADALLFRNPRRDDNDGNMVDDFVGTHLPAHLQSVHAGHHQVGDDEVGHEVEGLGKPVLAVAGIRDGIAA